MLQLAQRIVRSRHARWLRQSWRGPSPVILMYHRICWRSYDPWGLAVTPALFADQLQALAAARTVVSMDTLAEKLRSDRVTGREVAITFDDGYVDNLTTAKPLLERVGLPATVFLTTERLGATEEFWWDELAQLCLGNPEAADVELTIGGRSVRVRWRAELRPARPEFRWDAPRTARERLYLELWGLLKGLGESQRALAMQELRERLGAIPADSASLPLRREQVPALVEGGLISVGGHARTHQPLGSLSAEAQWDELESCKRELEVITRRSISGFAYPFGDRSDETKTLAARAGYGWAVATHTARVDRNDFDLFDLPRLHVQNWSGVELMRRITHLGASS